MWDVRALGNRNRYFVDVRQWKEVLNGVDGAAIIPVVCQVFYTYNVQVCLSGVTVAYLYQELGSAIRLQQVPTKFWPLTWTRSTIVSGYNAHPEFNDLYDFQAVVSHGSLNHGRRVLLSILYLLADTSRVGANTWKAAYYCLLFEEGERLLDCPGCNVNHPRIRNSELVREEITTQAMVALLLENYSEEEQEAKVSGLLLPVRLSAGVQCRDVRVSNIDACLGAMLQDERSPLGQRALSQRVLVEGPVAGGDQLVRYPFLRSSLAATGEVPVSDDTPLRAFTWLFAIKNVFVLMEGTLVEPGATWRWYLCSHSSETSDRHLMQVRLISRGWVARQCQPRIWSRV